MLHGQNSCIFLSIIRYFDDFLLSPFKKFNKKKEDYFNLFGWPDICARSMSVSSVAFPHLRQDPSFFRCYNKSYFILNVSSGRPPFDLNLPPALFDLNLPPAVEPEPASTSDLPQQEVELHPRMEEHIWARLIANSPPGTNPDLLFNQARETAQLKRQIVDRMPELDPDHSDFWVKHRDAIIFDSILTNRQTDYSPHSLSKMVVELTQGEAHASHAFQKMCGIRDKFFQVGTLKY